LTKILFAGDLHGSWTHLNKVFYRAQEVEADLIFQVGDFGWGWSFEGPMYVLDGRVINAPENGALKFRNDWFSEKVADLVRETGIKFYWIDGNHENHTGLRFVISHLIPESDGTYQINPGVFYIPRGTMMEWDGAKFLCCGGASSVDKNYRTEGVSWWPEEELTLEEVDRCIALGKSDFLVTHDFPWEVTVVDRHLDPYWGEERAAATAHHRQMISNIAYACDPKVVLHGHLHKSYNEVITINNHDVLVRGLDCDATPLQDSTCLLTVENGKWDGEDETDV
jgi:Icc-related predicted phosphoesterase